MVLTLKFQGDFPTPKGFLLINNPLSLTADSVEEKQFYLNFQKITQDNKTENILGLRYCDKNGLGS